MIKKHLLAMNLVLFNKFFALSHLEVDKAFLVSIYQVFTLRKVEKKAPQ
tara:strand:+ start:279 stop:425 length:147 start_codon:yes stop_codon:yes gene_type:complete